MLDKGIYGHIVFSESINQYCINLTQARLVKLFFVWLFLSMLVFFIFLMEKTNFHIKKYIVEATANQQISFKYLVNRNILINLNNSLETEFMFRRIIYYFVAIHHVIQCSNISDVNVRHSLSYYGNVLNLTIIKIKTYVFVQRFYTRSILFNTEM